MTEKCNKTNGNLQQNVAKEKNMTPYSFVKEFVGKSTQINEFYFRNMLQKKKNNILNMLTATEVNQKQNNTNSIILKCCVFLRLNTQGYKKFIATCCL